MLTAADAQPANKDMLIIRASALRPAISAGSRIGRSEAAPGRPGAVAPQTSINAPVPFARHTSIIAPQRLTAPLTTAASRECRGWRSPLCLGSGGVRQLPPLGVGAERRESAAKQAWHLAESAFAPQ